MGNKSSTGSNPAADEPTSSDHGSDFDVPLNLYTELRDMVSLSFLVYSFGYILEAARKYSDEFVGLQVVTGNEESTTTNRAARAGQAYKQGVSDQELQRSFTPSEVIDLIEKNYELLNRDFGSFEGSLASLKLLKTRAEEYVARGIERPLTLEEFDDKHQKHELVYGVTVDRIHKRVTLVFRGTDNELAFGTNWLTNLAVTKRSVQLPPFFEGKTRNDTVKLHSGFYGYLFEKTFDDSDDPDRRKFDEIIDDILQLLEKYKGFKLYITGHSLGGALASVVSLFLAADPRIQSPVTCITAAAPRVGDPDYADAVQVLESNGKLRYCRVVNVSDYVPLAPIFGYQHAGFQIRLSRDVETKPAIDYPKMNDSWSGMFGRTWGNSLLPNTNLSYDHGDYRERVDLHQAALQDINLDTLYESPDITGWSLQQE